VSLGLHEGGSSSDSDFPGRVARREVGKENHWRELGTVPRT